MRGVDDATLKRREAIELVLSSGLVAIASSNEAFKFPGLRKISSEL